MIVLDTSAIVEVLKGSKKGEEIKRFTEKETIAITSISVHELIFGATADELRKCEDFIETSNVLSHGKEQGILGGTIEKDLVRRGKVIGRVDIMIAAICRTHELPLLTLDKGFSRIPGLEVTVL